MGQVATAGTARSAAGSGRGARAEASEATRARLGRILRALKRARPSPRVELVHRSPWELLVATILSAQCTDARVNAVTPGLFARYREVADMAAAKRVELEAVIRPTGFFKSKARHLIACARMLHTQFHGQVPSNMEGLLQLPGVGRKTANVILGNCFGKAAVIVDTHVRRVSLRLGLVTTEDPDQIELALQALMPSVAWTTGSQRLLLHGRYVCRAKGPLCGECAVFDECPWEGKRRP